LGKKVFRQRKKSLSLQKVEILNSTKPAKCLPRWRKLLFSKTRFDKRLRYKNPGGHSKKSFHSVPV